MTMIMTRSVPLPARLQRFRQRQLETFTGDRVATVRTAIGTSGNLQESLDLGPTQSRPSRSS
ncbi:uncharacterized protein N7458_010199 [Penicillium daleae]|uniref:Uncharacterized protein n=1 Tax=Penicillium daleae TaxID=63821 RepID=A0AAD6BYI4_9EURO|nr:uncharacterized protein N7458_010199 [Penicillium daleae]KAJ5439201.1 hypothetical protein N7458_010199 [Penicillium daleae]